jgi:hypothetical protein
MQKKKDSPEHPTPLGLCLKVEHPQRGSLKLDLSEKVALRLTPCLIGLFVVSGGAWLWLNYLPHSPTTLPATAETQLRK